MADGRPGPRPDRHIAPATSLRQPRRDRGVLGLRAPGLACCRRPGSRGARPTAARAGCRWDRCCRCVARGILRVGQRVRLCSFRRRSGPVSRVSGLADLALSSRSGSLAAATRPGNFFPGADECGVKRGNNVRVSQNCLNVTDPDLQGRAQAQNETAVAVDPNNRSGPAQTAMCTFWTRPTAQCSATTHCSCAATMRFV